MSASEPGRQRSYASGARLLSVGIASTGLLTFAYFALANHLLDGRQYAHLDLLWSVMFVIISVIYRPIEQLLARTIAARRARGLAGQPLRTPIALQGAFALAFLAVALPLHHELSTRVFDSNTLFWVLVTAVLAYAASYFARGWLAGHRYFALYGALVFLEALSRIAFAAAVAVGLAHGLPAVALGIVAAPFVSLVVVPAAFARRGRSDAAQASLLDAALAGPGTEGVEEAAAELSIRHGAGFAVSVSAIGLAEQTLLNAAVLTVAATSGRHSPAAGIVFNVLLITRAPLQLFQAIQTSLLPHLAGLEATDGSVAFARAIRVTVSAIGAFALAVALGLLAIGPFAMRHVFHYRYGYDRFGLALIALGMGLHLCAGALNQAALARGAAGRAAAAWGAAAALFLAWMIASPVHEQITRTEVGYAGAAGLLALALLGLYRRGSPTTAASAA